MKICFLDNTNFEYSYLNKFDSKLRGAETILINLSEQLEKLGHDVTVLNNCSFEIHKNSSKWYNITRSNHLKNVNFDIAIVNADVRFLDKIKAKKKYVISFSLQSLEKFIRKKQLFSYIKHKPTYLLIGKYHDAKRSKLITLFGSKIIDLAIDDIFNNTILTNKIDPNLAIFTSHAERNLDLLIDIWNKEIYPNFNNGKLLITPKSKFIEKNNIFFRKMASKQVMINDLLKSRVYLVPGHKAELFCLAAEEARELCLPIVTLGIGSLKERVVHEKTGFIAKNSKEFANYTIELFKNNFLWNDIRNNLLNLRGSKSWSIASQNFLKQII
jgi:glycosyltransferase involved in cell wall biosynthesis